MHTVRWLRQQLIVFNLHLNHKKTIMMVSMLINNNAVFTMPLITGVTDEVRVQSEEPDLCFHASSRIIIRSRFNNLS